MTDNKTSPKTGGTVARIGAGGVVLAAVITGIFAWLASGDGQNPHPKPNVSSTDTNEVVQVNASSTNTNEVVQVTFEKIESIPQLVNRKLLMKPRRSTFSGFLQGRWPWPAPERRAPQFRVLPDSGEEIATYRFVVKNDGKAPVTLTKGEYLVDSVTLPPSAGGFSSTMMGISLIDHDGHIEAPVKSPKVGETITFPLNFSIAPDTRREFTVWFRGIDRDAPVFFSISGRIRIHAEGGYITSRPIKLVLHRESQTMRQRLAATTGCSRAIAEPERSASPAAVEGR